MNELLCDRCANKNICKYRDVYGCAQKAVNELKVNLDDDRKIELRLMSWIERVQLKCKHYKVNKETIIR